MQLLPWVLLAVAWIACADAQAQELLPATPYAAGFALQPALCGAYEGDWRLSLQAFNRNIVQPRSQGGTKTVQQMNHYSLQLERDLNAPWYKGAAGLWLDSERFQGLSIQHAQVALAYDVPLGARTRYHRLRAGFQGGAIQYQVDPDAFTYEDQFDGQGFSGASGQQAPRESLIRYDMSMGMIFYRIQKIRGNPEFNYYLGGALRHLNRPQIGFLASEERQLSMQSLVQAGGILRTRSPWELLPGLIFQHQNDRSNWIGHLALRYSIHEGGSILGKRQAQALVGLYYRPNYSYTILAGLGVEKRWRFAFTYDLRASQHALLQGSRGGMGVALQWLWGSISDEAVNQSPFPDF